MKVCVLSAAGHRDLEAEADNACSSTSTAEMLCRFESLGQNCEFGFVQRHAGAEPMGLLRFAGMPFDQLIRALQTEFADLDASEQLEVVVKGGEYRVRFHSLGLRYHTYLNENDIDVQHLLRVERRKVRFLARQLIDDLRGKRKIFVYQQRESHRSDNRDALAHALSRYDAPLLWIDAADPDNPPGAVERMGENVMRGYVRLAPDETVHEPDMESWLEVCRAAFRLWFPGPHLRVVFGAGGNALSYAEEGWSQPEPSFTWTIGQRSRLTLPRPPMDEVMLSLSVAPFVHPPECSAQRLSVVVNGCEVADYTLQEETQLQCVIPRGTLAAHDALSIAFHHPDAVSPSRFPDGNGDTRQLAVLFRSLALHAL